ncbi:PstS family phosphate ABC transporter substrate-binding protein [Steroidobacter flavus]|uniref:Phosphate-binding protein n=1 Tax=Steroidobacter flavus TaxID=1842136 RepID=A0ABV8SQP2_9GAMM
MNTRRLAVLALAAQLSVVLTGCGKQDGTAPTVRMGADTPVIRIDGSSTVFPIAEAVAEEFQSEQRGAVRVTVGLSGTGGGFKKLCRGDIDISNASRPILTEEMEMCRKAGINFIELPVAFDAITVVVNPKNDWVKSLTVADLKKMWEPGAQGQVMRWNQVRPEWPDAPLMLFGPGADSGTFDYFTEAVSGKAKSSRGDYTASEDDNVLVQGVENNKNALGYFGFAYYVGHKDRMRAVPIEKEDGTQVLPSNATVVDGTYQPLSRPLFIYVSDKSAQRPEVRQLIEYYLTEGPSLAADVGFVALPDQAAKTALQHFTDNRLGTVFGGVPEVGVTIDELLKRDAKL